MAPDACDGGSSVDGGAAAASGDSRRLRHRPDRGRVRSHRARRSGSYLVAELMGHARLATPAEPGLTAGFRSGLPHSPLRPASSSPCWASGYGYAIGALTGRLTVKGGVFAVIDSTDR